MELDSESRMQLVLRNRTGEPQLVDPLAEIGTIQLDTEPMLGSGTPVEPVVATDGVEVKARVVLGEGRGSSDAQCRRTKLAQIIEVCGDACTAEEAVRLRACVLDSHDTFALEKAELGEVVEVQHHIETGDSPPVRQPPRRVPFVVRPEITRMINEMLHAHVIQESSSPWASLVVLVKKKSGELRFCVDHRRLNAVTRKDVFPLPRIDDLLDQLSGKSIFSTLDARSGYWQIQVECSQPKTAFVTMDGLYEFRVMPFGLCNAPATFQRVVQRALAGLSTFCSVYIDDVVVFSRSVEEHIEHQARVFNRLRRIGLKLHPQKCRFAYREVPYLGHVISGSGISPDPNKIRAVAEFRVPTSARAVREFVGLASFTTGGLSPTLPRLRGPCMHGLTRKDVTFVWTPRC